jgi:hypothetical protein
VRPAGGAERIPDGHDTAVTDELVVGNVVSVELVGHLSKYTDGSRAAGVLTERMG